MTTHTWLLILAVLVVLGSAAALVWILLKRRRQANPGGAVAASAAAGSDTQFLAKEAARRLQGSSRPPLSRLPVVLIVGESGSTKTTAVVNSGLDPELLAGQDRQQESGPVPSTPCANFWLAGGAVFVEAGGPLLASPGGVAALASQLRAASTASLLGAGQQAPRALVVCVDAADFLKPDASSAAVAAAKRIRAIVGEVAQTWASRMPMYVLFTKMDRISYFADYVRNLSMDEAGRVFGFTLPLAGSLQPGIYNQEQAARLNNAFDELQNAFTDSRIELLRRENEIARTPNTFEFPREFRKLRDDMVRFLVELGRPSQLQATPFLRGFFFTGARPVTLSGQSAAPRRVPQWVFLNGFFTEALLGDRLAFQAASSNTGAGAARNWILGAAAALSLFWFGGATVSYFQNRSLLHAAQEAATAVKPLGLASVERVRELENLRQPAAEVSSHRKYGPPMSHRWGVYPGESMQQALRDTYCRELQQTMLSETRQTLASRLRNLPSAPGPNDNYDTPYRDLKAYLILTTNPERSDAGFLGSVLTARWMAARGAAASDELARLARLQFQFLGSEQPSGSCGGKADVAAIAQARTYLRAFPLVDRAYRSMVDEVNRQGPPVRFLDPTKAMTDPREVGFAFSSQGFASMKSAMGKALEYLDREPWVLNNSTTTGKSPEGLLTELANRYQSDYIGQWNAFVDAAAVSRFTGLKDAASKLAGIASPASPMTRLFCLVSVNTQVENAVISDAFKPFQRYAPPGSCLTAATGPGNQQYMQGLIGLQVGVDRIASAPNPDAERLTESDPAKTAAMTTAQQLNLGPKPAQLLLDPVIYAEALLKGVPAASANGKGAGFCSEIRPVLAKYPFNSSAGAADVQPSELAAVFAPNTGRLFMFQQEALQEFLVPGVGGRFMPKLDARVPVNPAFVSFFNRAANLSRFLYAAGPAPRLPLTLEMLPSPDIEGVALQVGSKTLKPGGRQDFVWPDETMTVRLRAGSSALESTGPWALTRFFGEADETSSAGSRGTVVYRLKMTLGRATLTRGEALLRINIDMKGAPMTLLPRDLQLSCIGAIALR